MIKISFSKLKQKIRVRSKSNKKHESHQILSIVNDLRPGALFVPAKSARNHEPMKKKSIERVQQNYVITQFNRRKTILETITKQNKLIHRNIEQQRSQYSQSNLLKYRQKGVKRSVIRSLTSQKKQSGEKSQDKNLRLNGASPKRKNGLKNFDKEKWQNEEQSETALHRYVQSFRKILIKGTLRNNYSELMKKQKSKEMIRHSTRSLPNLKE